MNSTMTEKDFRERLKCAGVWADVAVRVAREAGLEFAPEPVKLPERLVVNSSGGRSKAQVDAPGKAWCFELLEPEPGVVAAQGRMQEQRMAVFLAAIDRYNAYPGLFREAERLLVAAREAKVLFGECQARTDLVAGIQGLEAALARSPEP